MKRVEAITPRETLKRLLAAAGSDLILVGGQALAVWVSRYDVQLPPMMATISADVDFFTLDPADRAAVDRFARVLRGQAIFPPRRALTSLVGQAIRVLDEREMLNVDVIFKVVGLTPEQIVKSAVPIWLPSGECVRVMHPLEVMRSRVVNLYELPEKQNDKGAMQLRLAVEAVRGFLRSQASESPAGALASGRSPIQGLVSAVEQLSCEDAARKVAARWGIHTADAIDPFLIPLGPFWTKRWPGLRELMSPEYRQEMELRITGHEGVPEDANQAGEEPRPG